ncbi:RNA recognition motif domain-containing protein [Rubritalea marina]|uniref:RNA recognition motif domain-containing protein n=1 Tax=Rubritalea marina TaxID=361055 RepID=UPI00036AC1B3|nr:RNA-binding protein [Rubritalea marina]
MSETNNKSQGGGNRQPRRNNNNRNRNRNGQRRNNNNNRRRQNRKPKPLKLTFWQKVLKALGLFDEEKAREAQRKQHASNKKPQAPKSNVRNAKTGNEDKKRSRKPQPVPVESARLYVGNLSYDATEFDLEELFKGVGTVKNVEIIYNRNTHKSKGYGFIQMLNTEEAKRAVEVLHDQPFMGRQLVVNGSKARNDSNNESQNNTADTESN